MKDIALVEKHIELGAKMVPFAGYNMPVQYEGVNIEHETVRNGVGVFDSAFSGGLDAGLFSAGFSLHPISPTTIRKTK